MLIQSMYTTSVVTPYFRLLGLVFSYAATAALESPRLFAGSQVPSDSSYPFQWTQYSTPLSSILLPRIRSTSYTSSLSLSLGAWIRVLGRCLDFPILMAWHIVHRSMSHPDQVGQLGPVLCPSKGIKPCALHILHWSILLFTALTPLHRLAAAEVFLAGAVGAVLPAGAVFRSCLPRNEFRTPQTPASCALVGAYFG